MEMWTKFLKWATWPTAIFLGVVWIPLPDRNGVPQDLRAQATFLIAGVVILCMGATLGLSRKHHRRLWLWLTCVSFITALCVTAFYFWASQQWLCEVRSIDKTFVIGTEFLNPTLEERIKDEERHTGRKLMCLQILSDTASPDISPEYAWKIDGIERHRNTLSILYFAIIPIYVLLLSSGTQFLLCLQQPDMRTLSTASSSDGSDSSANLKLQLEKQSPHEREDNKVALGYTQNDFTVFISYAHEDNKDSDQRKRWLDRLLEHLQPLVLQDQVGVWSDTRIGTGENWQESLQTQLQNAKVAVLLVSPAFLASEYIRNNELPVLLMKAKKMGVIVLPIIIRHCLFSGTKFKYLDPESGRTEEIPLSIFQSANPPSEPLNSMEEHEQDKVLLSIAQRIQELAQRHP